MCACRWVGCAVSRNRRRRRSIAILVAASRHDGRADGLNRWRRQRLAGHRRPGHRLRPRRAGHIADHQHRRRPAHRRLQNAAGRRQMADPVARRRRPAFPPLYVPQSQTISYWIYGTVGTVQNQDGHRKFRLK